MKDLGFQKTRDLFSLRMSVRVLLSVDESKGRTEKAAFAAFSLECEKRFSVSECSSEGPRRSLGDRFSRFHHTTVGIVRRRIWRKLPAFEIRRLWPWQRRSGRNQIQWRRLKERSQPVMCEEIS